MKEFGLSSAAYAEMLSDEVREALLQTVKYPMKGALTEYWADIEGWRALPFSAGSFLFTITALLLQSLPRGLAVRASDLLERIDKFEFRTSTIDAVSSGSGDIVQRWSLNGREIPATLQIPEQLLRTGRNSVEVTCGESFEAFRLYGSSARLYSVEEHGEELLYHFSSAIPCELFFENFSRRTAVSVQDGNGRELSFDTDQMEGTGLTRITVASDGDFTVTVR